MSLFAVADISQCCRSRRVIVVIDSDSSRTVMMADFLLLSWAWFLKKYNAVSACQLSSCQPLTGSSSRRGIIRRRINQPTPVEYKPKQAHMSQFVAPWNRTLTGAENWILPLPIVVWTNGRRCGFVLVLNLPRTLLMLLLAENFCKCYSCLGMIELRVLVELWLL